MEEDFSVYFANPISPLPEVWTVGLIPQLAFFSYHLKAIL